jgi:hypothetical protein
MIPGFFKNLYIKKETNTNKNNIRLSDIVLCEYKDHAGYITADALIIAAALRALPSLCIFLISLIKKYMIHTAAMLKAKLMTIAALYANTPSLKILKITNKIRLYP